MRVEVARPFAGAALLDFLLRHRVAGVETGGVTANGSVEYARTVRLPHGPGVVRLTWDGSGPAGSGVTGSGLAGSGLTGSGLAGSGLTGSGLTGSGLTAELDVDARDHATALARVRHLVDADADVAAVDAHLGADPHLAELVRATPGLRVPGVLAAEEMVFRTVIGQQISLASASTSAGTITRRHGEALPGGDDELSLLFPTAEVLAAVDPASLPMPRARGRTMVALAERLAEGRIDLTAEPAAVRASLLACPGIGPWTADYVLMRVCHAPDILLRTDLVIARQLTARGITDTSAWSPYRSYAALHLWHAFLNPGRDRLVRTELSP